MSPFIYLDNAATTAVRPEVLSKMLPFFTEKAGNPSSIHSAGRETRKAVENARRQVAAALHAEAREIYFTAGGSESDNWAIRCAAAETGKKHVITSAVEHHAVLHSCRALERDGFRVTYLPVDENGLVSPDDVRRALTDDTALISIMTANNEVGTLEPVREIGQIAREAGVLFHTDAVQERRSAFPLRPQVPRPQGRGRAVHPQGNPHPQSHRGRRAGTGASGRNGKRARHCGHGRGPFAGRRRAI